MEHKQLLHIIILYVIAVGYPKQLIGIKVIKQLVTCSYACEKKCVCLCLKILRSTRATSKNIYLSLKAIKREAHLRIKLIPKSQYSRLVKQQHVDATEVKSECAHTPTYSPVMHFYSTIPFLFPSIVRCSSHKFQLIKTTIALPYTAASNKNKQKGGK